MATVLKFFKNRKRSSSMLAGAGHSENSNTSPTSSDSNSSSLVSPDSSIKLLRRAIINNDPVAVRKIMDAQPGLSNAVLNDADQTALHLASELGSIELIEYLLTKCGSDPNKVDEQLQARQFLFRR